MTSLEKEVGKSLEVGLKPIQYLGDAYGTQELANEMKKLLKTQEGRKKVSKANDYESAAFSMRSPPVQYNPEKIGKMSYKDRLKKFKMEKSKKHGKFERTKKM